MDKEMNRKFSNRLCAALLAALTVCTVMPFAVSADDMSNGTGTITVTPPRKFSRMTKRTA